MFQRFNNVLALIIVVGYPALIVAAKAANIELDGAVVGSLVAGLVLVIQFHFRKSEPKA